MSTLIIGGGLAGLATAVKLKLANPDVPILLVDYPNANTQIAGQRYNRRIGGRIGDISSLKEHLLTRASNPKAIEGIDKIVDKGNKQIDFWQKLDVKRLTKNRLNNLPYAEDERWFGPKWGGEIPNAGKFVINWFRTLATEMGVQMKKEIVIGVEVSSGQILHVTMRDGVRITADHYVFAGGNPAGNMFYSTNKRIEFSPHELLYGKAGVGFIGLNRFMIHPFGRCNSEGKSTVGCLETDDLAGCMIFLNDGDGNFTIRDPETEELLKAHQAHYYFSDISTRFFNHGGVVKVVNPISEKVNYARVAHHYSQLAFKMQENYVGIEGLHAAYAVGDAAGIGRYTGGKVRIPGLALTACLVDAELAASLPCLNKIGSDFEYSEPGNVNMFHDQPPDLRELNTSFMMQMILQKKDLSAEWMRTLNNTREYPLIGLSRLTARALGEHFRDPETSEGKVYYPNEINTFDKEARN